MRYYYQEHIEGYERVRAEGKVSWGEIHGVEGFENFSARDFLSEVLPVLRFDSSEPTVFNYGCGTGPDACFLAERGFRVDAVDLIPTAIEIAREQAAIRGLDIHYAVQDICELPHEGKRYDMIVDSFCLQCIVPDSDRRRVFSAVRARLNPSGYYLISTAVLNAERERLLEDADTITDSATGIVYKPYPGGLIDQRTGTVIYPLDAMDAGLPDAVRINGMPYAPRRRHLTPAQLEAELIQEGFSVTHRFPELGSVVCVLQA